MPEDRKSIDRRSGASTTLLTDTSRFDPIESLEAAIGAAKPASGCRSGEFLRAL